MAQIQIRIIFEGHFIQICEYSNIRANHCCGRRRKKPVSELQGSDIVLPATYFMALSFWNPALCSDLDMRLWLCSMMAVSGGS